MSQAKDLGRAGAYRRDDGPLNLLVDSTVIKFLGDGEWQARKHGTQRPRRCNKAIVDRYAIPIIPIRKSGRLWKETLRASDTTAGAFWKRWTGYHARSQIEARMHCLKSFGERIAARDPDRQTAEIHLLIALMNRFAALGTVEIVHLA